MTSFTTFVIVTSLCLWYRALDTYAVGSSGPYDYDAYPSVPTPSVHVALERLNPRRLHPKISALGTHTFGVSCAYGASNPRLSYLESNPRYLFLDVHALEINPRCPSLGTHTLDIIRKRPAGLSHLPILQ